MGAEIYRTVTPDAIRGAEIPPEAMSDWDRADIITGPAHSQNIPLIHALNYAAYNRTRNRRNFLQVMGAWERYFDLPFHTTEPFSSFVYGHWIPEQIQGIENLARLEGTSDSLLAKVSDKARRNRRVNRIMWALSAAPFIEHRTWPGYPVTMTGARSWVSRKVDGSYIDPRIDYVAKPYTLDQTQLSMQLNADLHVRVPPSSTHYADFLAALRSIGCTNLSRTSDRERERLFSIMKKRSPVWTRDQRRALKWCVRRLNEVPAPQIPVLVGRYTECVWWLCERSINPGSTSMRYGLVRYHGRRPSGGWWSEPAAKWNLHPNYLYLAVDPTRRNSGTTGRAEWNGRMIRAQRTNSREGSPRNSWWHPSRGFVPGWQEVPLRGDPILVLRWGPRGVEILEGPEV